MKFFICIKTLIIFSLIVFSGRVFADHCTVSQVKIIRNSSVTEETIEKTSYTIQAQDESGEACHANQTLRFSIETTGTGDFTSPSGGQLTYNIASSTANRNFIYVHNHGESYVLNVLAGYGDIDNWSTIFSNSFNQEYEVEIEEPEPYYRIIEKPRFLFGDSVELDGYFGLENYTKNYINGYAHITFTYTHFSNNQYCCYASYPPKILITEVDPSATTSPEIKSDLNLYPLYQYTHYPEHITGWYLYDIQFNSQGYVVSVKREGVTEIANETFIIPNFSDSDWAALRNTYPYDPQFPSDHSMAFTPIQVREITTPTEEGSDPEEPDPGSLTPVIIVPGIMGSYLNKDDGSNKEVWMDLPKMVLSISDDYLNDLSLSVDGGGVNGLAIKAGDIIKNSGNNDFFGGLISALEGSGYVIGSNLFIFPYDWRLDIASSSEKLKQKIEEVVSLTGANKIDIVAHSMGGLVVKKYIKDSNNNLIKNFIDIGTPHLGSSKSFKILMYGDDLNATLLFGLIGLNDQRIKYISQNMPSVYQLLPSRSYFAEIDDYYIWNGVNDNNRLDFEETKDYLNGAGRNSKLVERADVLHQEIDNINPADYGVETYNIVSCGVPTLGQIYILEKEGEHYNYNIRLTDGDGTVPLRSAEAMPSVKTYYVKGAQHGTLPSTTGVKELIVSLLSSESEESNISLYTNLSLSSGECGVPNGRIVSFHSPITLDIYDSAGNHSGPNENGDIENNIPGVVYEVIDGNKFAFLPEGISYTVSGRSTGIGSFDIRIEDIVDGEVATTTIFNDIPLTPITQTQFVINDLVPTEIFLDYDGDNVHEASQLVSTTTSGLLFGTGELVVEKISEPTLEPVDVVVTQSGTRLSYKDKSRTVETHDQELVVAIPPIYRPSTKVFKTNIIAQLGNSSIYQIKNTATVYEAFTNVLKNTFKKWWSWFKSKL